MLLKSRRSPSRNLFSAVFVKLPLPRSRIEAGLLEVSVVVIVGQSALLLLGAFPTKVGAFATKGCARKKKRSKESESSPIEAVLADVLVVAIVGQSPLLLLFSL